MKLKRNSKREISRGRNVVVSTVLLFVLFLSLPGCSVKGGNGTIRESDLVGSWSLDEAGIETLVFDKDHTYKRLEDENYAKLFAGNPIIEEGNWSLQDGVVSMRVTNDGIETGKTTTFNAVFFRDNRLYILPKDQRVGVILSKTESTTNRSKRTLTGKEKELIGNWQWDEGGGRGDDHLSLFLYEDGMYKIEEWEERDGKKTNSFLASDVWYLLNGTEFAKWAKENNIFSRGSDDYSDSLLILSGANEDGENSWIYYFVTDVTSHKLKLSGYYENKEFLRLD